MTTVLEADTYIPPLGRVVLLGGGSSLPIFQSILTSAIFKATTKPGKPTLPIPLRYLYKEQPRAAVLGAMCQSHQLSNTLTAVPFLSSAQVASMVIVDTYNSEVSIQRMLNSLPLIFFP